MNEHYDPMSPFRALGKIILIVTVILAMVNFAFAAEADSVKTDNTELKTKIYQDVKSAVESIAESLKIGTEHVYEVLVAQQLVDSLTNIILYVFFMIVVICGTQLTAKLFAKGRATSEKYDESERWATFGVMSAVCTVIVIIIWLLHFAATINDTVTGFVNPEYGAIHQVIELITRK